MLLESRQLVEELATALLESVLTGRTGGLGAQAPPNAGSEDPNRDRHCQIPRPERLMRQIVEVER